MKRYRMTGESMGEHGVEVFPVEDPRGEWVEYADHLAAVSQLRDDLRAASAAERAATAPQGPVGCPCLKCQAFQSAREALDGLLRGAA